METVLETMQGQREGVEDRCRKRSEIEGLTLNARVYLGRMALFETKDISPLVRPYGGTGRQNSG